MISNLLEADPSFFTVSTTFEDSIAKICWHPVEGSHELAVSSWDSKIRLLHINRDQSITEKLTIQTQSPCLAICCQNDLSFFAAGSIDGTVSVFQTRDGGLLNNLGKHDDAVQGIYEIPYSSLLCSVSYDRTMRVWDMRQPGTAVKIIKLGEKAVCSDMAYPHMIIGLSNQKFHVFNIMSALQTLDVGPQMDTTLRSDEPLSSVSINGGSGAVGFGSASGRSVISWLSDTPDFGFTMNGTFCFRAHKLDPGQSGNTSNLKIQYPINAVHMHPQIRDTYLTAGNDGLIQFWNLNRRTRLSGFSTGGVPVTEAKWSPDAMYVAYGTGYDWSKGIEGAKSYKTELRIHTVQSNEVVNNETY